MKVTVVPAQVTTVEDRIIGNLGFSQILLLIIPVFASAGIFALLPPFMEVSPYKYIFISTSLLIFSTLAIRIKGKIIASWLVTIFRFNLRPKYYLFNKNTSVYREDFPAIKSAKAAQKSIPTERRKKPANYHVEVDIQSAAKILATIENPAANVRFETDRKGGLHVRFSEVEE